MRLLTKMLTARRRASVYTEAWMTASWWTEKAFQMKGDENGLPVS